MASRRFNWLLRYAATLHRFVWWPRGLTLGVRAIVFDTSAQVFLVRHSYKPGWYLPGGGVDRHETAEAAVIRELREEGALICRDRPLLHGLFYNRRLKRDHVACYIIRNVEAIAGATPDWEIAETGFFAVDALPPGTTRATRARLDEVLNGTPIATEW